MTAFIKGKPAAYEAALDQAASILRAATLPVIAGLGTDIAGGRAALRLAEKVGGAYDHMASSALAGETAAVQSGNYMATTAREARHRADVILALGAEAAQFTQSLPASIKFADVATEARGRFVISLAPGRGKPRADEIVDAEAVRLPGLVAMITAAVKDAPMAADGYCNFSAAAFGAMAEKLKAARFGVAVWSGSDLDSLGVHALMALLDTLNAGNRFSALPLAPGDNAAGFRDLSLWQTGFPGRCGFGRGPAEYDPWVYNANRLVDSGEADAAVWVSAFRPAAPAWKSPVPMIALTVPGTSFARPPEVHFIVGTPGVDHAGEAHGPDADVIMALTTASGGSDKPSVGTVLDALNSLLTGGLA